MDVNWLGETIALALICLVMGFMLGAMWAHNQMQKKSTQKEDNAKHKVD
jgi:hypothetical protein